MVDNFAFLELYSTIQRKNNVFSRMALFIDAFFFYFG